MALWQEQPDGVWRLLQCGSRHVSSTEARYSATEIELLVVVWATRKARAFLAGTEFELIVDYRPLIPIINSKTLDELSSPRIVRLKEKLAMFRMNAVWRPGIHHKVVDCLSCYPTEDPSDVDQQEEVVVENHSREMLLVAALDLETGEQILEDCLLSKLKSTAGQDLSYSKLKSTVERGSPRTRMTWTRV